MATAQLTRAARALAVWAMLLLCALMARADAAALDQAFMAQEAGDPTEARRLAAQALAGDLTAEDALQAREVVAFADYALDQIDLRLRQELAQIDADWVRLRGDAAHERIPALTHLSAVESILGLTDASVRTDIQIVRLTRGDPDAEEDFLIALRNLAVEFNSAEDALLAARFAAVYEFYAKVDLNDASPMAMEATALTALALFDLPAPLRAGLRYAIYTQEDWAGFAALGPYEADLVADLEYLVAEAFPEGLEAHLPDLQAIYDKIFAQEAAAAEISALNGEGRFDEALPRMEAYLAEAWPEDVYISIMLPSLVRYHIFTGDFAAARAYLGGAFDFPAPYAAALGVPLDTLALATADQGGAEDDVLGALLDRALAVEAYLRRPDPLPRAELLYRRGEMRWRLGETAAATEDFQAVVAMLTDGPHERLPLFHKSLWGAGLTLSELDQGEAAIPHLTRMLELARAGGHTLSESAALGALSRIQFALGREEEANALADEKLRLEQASGAPEDLRSARLNRGIQMFAADPRMTPELEALLIEVMAGEVARLEFDEPRFALLRHVYQSLEFDVARLREDPVFVTLDPATRADLLTGLAAGALDADDPAAAAFVDFGLTYAEAPSTAFFRLKVVEGQIAKSEGRHADALMAFRAISDHQIQPAAREAPGALDHLPLHISAAFDMATDPGLGADFRFHREALMLAQLAGATRAGGALNDAMARRAASDAIADKLRERQNAARTLRTLEAAIDRARYDGLPATEFRTRAETLRARHAALTEEIAAEAPDLANMAAFNPVRMEGIAERLRADEALIIYVTSDLEDGAGAPASFAIAITQEHIQIARIAARSDLKALTRDLRCAASLTDARCGGEGVAGARGAFSLSPAGPTGPAFDAEAAHLAYLALIAPVEDAITGKRRLIIAPDSALVSMPFHLALKAPLRPGESVRDARWLIRDHAVELTPTVQSFVAMRDRAAVAERPVRFLGVGDPLIGVQRRGPVDVVCATPAGPAETLTELVVAQADLSRGAGQDRTRAISELAALPEARCELRQIAGAFGPDSTVLLHDAATEGALKALDAAKELRDYSVISFATHGLVAGELGFNAAGLVLTPPDVPTAEDDGLLTTAEIAALDLDADFVILSACNTASGDEDGAEGLSGMASAFLFAGAQSLLVSHWPVASDAAVRLTTTMFATLEASPGVSRAEAARAAMLDILDDPAASPRQLHPSYWAPFMIVGDGLGL